jgi:hypothetical protein
MKKYLWGISIAVIALVAAGLWYTSQPAVAPEGSVDIVVKIGNAAPSAIQLPAGSTALAATQAVAEVQLEGEGELAVVTGIDGIVPDTNKQEFWKLVINGEDVPVGAGTYVVQDHDTVAWEVDSGPSPVVQ